MGIIPCSWSWCHVCIKRSLPSFFFVLFCFPSLSLPNRIEIKPVSVFIKVIFPLNWRLDFVNIEISRHSGHMILVPLLLSSVRRKHTVLPRGQRWFPCGWVLWEEPYCWMKAVGEAGAVPFICRCRGQSLVWCGRDLKWRGCAGNILSQTLIYFSSRVSRLSTHPQSFHACFGHSAGQSQPPLPAFFQGIGGSTTEWWNRAWRGTGRLQSLPAFLST